MPFALNARTHRSASRPRKARGCEIFGWWKVVWAEVHIFQLIHASYAAFKSVADVAVISLEDPPTGGSLFFYHYHRGGGAPQGRGGEG